MSSTGNDDTRIRRRLDVIINLLLEQGSSPAKTATEKIKRLLDFGLTPTETGAILGKAPKYVTSIKSRRRQTE